MRNEERCTRGTFETRNIGNYGYWKPETFKLRNIEKRGTLESMEIGIGNEEHWKRGTLEIRNEEHWKQGTFETRNIGN